ncbi:S-layer homology domain-containing protein [Fusibacter sp. JL216-2]|uniref:S-layer homology domain-containing protein n=1 Tax=Fusibacter sp. JL216-2 TaxID=3071453 RepID=UPI003D35059E
MYRKILAMIILVSMFTCQIVPCFASGSFYVATSKKNYNVNETIEIQGAVNNTKYDEPVTIIIKNWENTAVYYIDEIQTDHNGDFNIKVSSHGMKEGYYILKARHGSMVDSAGFSISEVSTQVDRKMTCQVGDVVRKDSPLVLKGQISENDTPVVGIITVKVTDEKGQAISYVDELLSKFDGTFECKIGTENFKEGKVILKLAFGDAVIEKTIEVKEKIEYILDIEDVSEYYYEGQTINIRGQSLENGKGESGKVSLYVDDIYQSDHQTDVDGTLDIDLSTHDIGLGSHVLFIQYGDVVKSVDVEVVQNDYQLTASSIQTTYYESQDVVVEGQISTNGHGVSEDVTLSVDGSQRETLRAENGIFKMIKSAQEIGTGQHELILEYRDQSLKLNFEIIEDVYDSSIELSREEIDYGQGISVSGSVEKNHNPLADQVEITVFDQDKTINTESLYKEAVMTKSDGHYSLSIPKSVFKMDGNYEIRLAYKGRTQSKILKVHPVYALESQSVSDTYKLGENILVSGQISRNTSPVEGQVKLTFTQGEKSQVETLIADEEGRFAYTFSTLECKSGELHIKATYEGQESELETQLISYTELSLEPLEKSYMYGDSVLLSGRGEKDGKPLTSTLKLAIYDKTDTLVTEGQIEPNEDGTFSYSYDIDSGLGSHVLFIQYGDVVKSVDVEVVQNDYQLTASSIQTTYYESQDVVVEGQISTNGHGVSEDVTLSVDGSQRETLRAENGIFKMIKSAQEIGTGQHELILEYRDQSLKLNFEIIEDVYDSSIELSREEIDYGQGISVSGSVEKNHNPLADQVEITVFDQDKTINTESLYKEAVMTKSDGHYSLSIPKSVFKMDGNYEIRLAYKGRTQSKILKVHPVYALESQSVSDTYKLGENILVSGQISRNTSPVEGQVKLTFTQGEKSQVETLIADEEGRFAYTFSTLECKSGELHIKATYEGQESELETQLISYTDLSLEPLEKSYMYGDRVLLSGRGEKDGKPLTSTLKLAIYDKTDTLVTEGQIEPNEDGTFSYSYDTSGCPEGAVRFEVSYKDQIAKASSEMLYDYNLFVKTLKATYKLGQKIDLKGQVEVNGQKSKAHLVYLIDDQEKGQTFETRDNGTFKHTLNSENIGRGTHTITVKFNQEVFMQTIIINDKTNNQSGENGSSSKRTSSDKKSASSSSGQEQGNTIIKVEEEEIAEGSLEKAGDLKNLIQSVMEKTGYVSYNNAKVDVSLTDIKKELEDSVETAKELVKQLSQSPLSSDTASIRPRIHLEVEGDKAAYEINLQTDLVSELRETKADVELEMPKMSFRVSSDLIKKLGEGNLSVKVERLEGQDLQNLKGRITESGLEVDIASDVMDIEFKSGDKDISIGTERPELTMNVEKMAQMLKTKSHLLSVFVYNDEFEKWENVPSKIVNGVAKFKAPHFSKYAVLKVNVDFNDIENHWAKETIELMSANDITRGRSNTSFAPDENITRAEFTAYLVNAMDLQGLVNGNFKDVSKSDWYYDQVAIAAVNGLVSGVGGGKFAPDEPVSRQDMALMLSKAEALINDGTIKNSVPIRESEYFIDDDKVSEYAYDAVYDAREQGLIGGFKDGSFRPLKKATRAEAAQMLRVLWEQNVLN